MYPIAPRIKWLLSTGSESEQSEAVFKAASEPGADWNPEWQTFTTNIYTYDTKFDQAMHIKGVADEFLAATGTVLGVTASLFGRSSGGIPTGAEQGRRLGDALWTGANWLTGNTRG